jgi:hypothetical protein
MCIKENILKFWDEEHSKLSEQVSVSQHIDYFSGLTDRTYEKLSKDEKFDLSFRCYEEFIKIAEELDEHKKYGIELLFPLGDSEKLLTQQPSMTEILSYINKEPPSIYVINVPKIFYRMYSEGNIEKYIVPYDNDELSKRLENTITFYVSVRFFEDWKDKTYLRSIQISFLR